MAVEFTNAILAGVTLIREAIQSQNFVQGESGWQIAADGTAEFSDLTIRSSDGSESTVTVANGQIVIANGSGATVVELDSTGYRLYDAETGNLAVQITVRVAGDGSGFTTGGLMSLDTNEGGTVPNDYGLLAGSRLTMGFASDLPEGNFVREGTLDWAPNDEIERMSLILSCGRYNVDTNEAQINLESNSGQRPKVWVRSGGFNDSPANLDVQGKVSAGNLRCGRTQTPSPGGTPGQTNVSVVFDEAMDGTPRVVVTPDSASTNLNNSNIRWSVSNSSSTGFQINCWRDTNAATNFDWFAMS